MLSKRGIHVAAGDERGSGDSREFAQHPRACRSSSRSTACSPEHDVRRTPATYDRILKHIVGHSITVHCTVTRQQVNRPGLHRGVPADSGRRKRRSRKIWVSLYTPQVGEVSEERLRPADREQVVADLLGAAAALSEARAAQGADRRLREPAGLAGRMRLRAHHARRSRRT